MITGVNRRSERAGGQPIISKEEARFLGFASLLHDITHIPFGHTFEDERRILPAHDNSSERLHYFSTMARWAKFFDCQSPYPR